MKNFAISLVYSVDNQKRRESGYIRDESSVAAHRQVVMALPKTAQLNKIIIKEVKL